MLDERRRLCVQQSGQGASARQPYDSLTPRVSFEEEQSPST